VKIDLRNIAVYYVNLDHDVDKKEKTENMLKNMGFNNIHRVSACIHQKGRIIGCARSHHKILSTYNEPFIILEDDCTFNSDFDGYIDIPEDAEAVYLGISHWGRYLNHSGPFVHIEKTTTDCVRVYNMLATHAILYLSLDYVKMCEKVAHYHGYVIENHVDIGFAEIQKYFNVYALDNPLFMQYEWSAITRGKLSDNSIDIQHSEEFYNAVTKDDDNFYKINSEFRSPFRQLISQRDVNGVPGYFVPTRLI
jgi:hypothetical protein